MAHLARIVLLVIFAGALAACNNVLGTGGAKENRPIPKHILKKMEIKGMRVGAPILLRIYKEENQLEVWMQDHTKRYAFLTSYEICKWSGKLGPKLKEGDKQAPEGFYHVNKGLMNPRSQYHLSFNMGFPNIYDRAHGRTGSHLMIHGACSSAGCYSMTDEYVEEIYAMAREAFKGGQKHFQIQAYPFRMTAENMAKNVGHKDFNFWVMLKEGSDHFEVTNLPPKVDVCEKRYVFNRYLDEKDRFQSTRVCPPMKTPRSLELAFQKKQSEDQAVFDEILNKKNSLAFSSEASQAPAGISISARPTQGPLVVFDPVVQSPDGVQGSAAVGELPAAAVPQRRPAPPQGS